MITTFTNVTTITTIATIAVLGLTAATSIASVVTLILLLTTKELAGASSSGTLQRIAKFVSVPIVPLLIVFAVIVGVKIVLILLSK